MANIFNLLLISAVVLLNVESISSSVYHPENRDLLVTLKGLHQTLSRLVDTLQTDDQKSGKPSGSSSSSSSGSSSGSSSSSSSSSSDSSLRPSSAGSSSLSRIDDKNPGSDEYPNQDKTDNGPGSIPPKKPLPGQRSFQCAPGYAGSYTRAVVSPEPGTVYTSNMLEARWNHQSGWDPAFIVPVTNLTVHPSSKALMYGQQVFEIIRANMGYDNRIRLLRPLLHVSALQKAASRLALPDFDEDEFLICLKRLVLSDASLIPAPYTNSSLEIRVVLAGIGSRIDIEPSRQAVLYVFMVPHTPSSLAQYTEPKTLYVDPQYARSWPGSLGEFRTPANFAPTFLPTHIAHDLGFNDVLYVYGKDELVTSLNDGNIFIFIINDRGFRELITPPTNGLIIPGITRKTILEMARHWNEFLVTERTISIHEIRTLHRQGRLIEMFSSHTMANTVPILSIHYEPKRDVIRVAALSPRGSLSNRFNRAFNSIENGLVDHPWGHII